MLRHLLLMGCCLLAAVSWTAPVAVAADDHAAESHGDDHADSGKPSLPIEFKGDLAIWSAVTFLLFLIVVSKIAWEPLGGALAAREAKIAGDIAAAEANRHKAEAMLRDYEAKLAKTQDEVKEILAEARRDAEHTKQEIVAAAQREAEANRQRAVADIDQAKTTAMTELYDFMTSSVINLTERVLHRNLNSDDQERLVREAMADLNVRRN